MRHPPCDRPFDSRVAAGLAALPWLCMKAGLLTHVGVPAFGILVLADAIIVAAILWRVVTGRP